MSEQTVSAGFVTRLVWSGREHGPTLDVDTFSRDLDVTFQPQRLAVSAAPAYHGDPARANPEQLFVAAVSSCQALTYLFLAARKGVAVTAYEDDATGVLDASGGKVRMAHVTLRPRIVLAPGADADLALALVDRAHRGCFIANSVSTTVEIVPRIEVAAHAVYAGA